MNRILFVTATAAFAIAMASPAFAFSLMPKAKPKAADTAQASQPAVIAPVAEAPPRRASALERAQADRMDALARAAFWSREAQVDGQDTEAGLKLAQALRAIGQYQEAVQAAQRVLVVQPSSTEALLEVARAHLASGHGFHAIEPLKAAQAAAPRDWRILSLLGVAYDQVSRGAEAVAVWRQALQIAPNQPALLSNLAMHEAAGRNLAEAERLLRLAVVQPGVTIRERQNLVLVLGLQGKLVEAEQLVRQDLPPELADNNLAYLRAAASGERSWDGLRGGS